MPTGEGDRIVITVHLPVDMGAVSTILAAVASQFPGAMVDYSGPHWKVDVGHGHGTFRAAPRIPFGDLVRDARIGKELTVSEAARQAGVNRSTWADIESGARDRPTPKTMARIRAVLGMGDD